MSRADYPATKNAMVGLKHGLAVVPNLPSRDPSDYYIWHLFHQMYVARPNRGWDLREGARLSDKAPASLRSSATREENDMKKMVKVDGAWIDPEHIAALVPWQENVGTIIVLDSTETVKCPTATPDDVMQAIQEVTA